MSLSSPASEREGRKLMFCATAILACASSLAFMVPGKEAVNFHSTSLASVRSNIAAAQALQADAIPRFATARPAYPTLPQDGDRMPSYAQPEAAAFIVGAGEAGASPLRSAGTAALYASVVLAVAGLALKAAAFFQPKRPTAGLSFMEMHHTVSMAAVTGDKAPKAIPDSKATKERRVKKVKAKKPKKGKKEEKPEKAPIVLTTKEVFKRMRFGARRVAAERAEPQKTTGRVCYLLGKRDNLKARSISFSHIRNKRIQRVNLHWKRMWWEEGKCFVMLRLSTKGLRTITKYGLHAAAIKFGLDLTKHVNGVSARKYTKYLPETEKKKALIRGATLRKRQFDRAAKLKAALSSFAPIAMPAAADGDAEEAAPAAEPAVIAMMVSHGVKKDRLGRPADQRKALLRSLTTELIRHGRIKTTMARAKAMRKRVDHIITLAKRGDLHARRQAISYIYDKTLVRTLFDQVPERYGNRPGGYTRILHTMPRKGDCAKMAYIELV